eukprot:963071-Rhodomonas_salina.1
MITSCFPSAFRSTRFAQPIAPVPVAHTRSDRDRDRDRDKDRDTGGDGSPGAPVPLPVRPTARRTLPAPEHHHAARGVPGGREAEHRDGVCRRRRPLAQLLRKAKGSLLSVLSPLSSLLSPLCSRSPGALRCVRRGADRACGAELTQGVRQEDKVLAIVQAAVLCMEAALTMREGQICEAMAHVHAKGVVHRCSSLPPPAPSKEQRGAASGAKVCERGREAEVRGTREGECGEAHEAPPSQTARVCARARTRQGGRKRGTDRRLCVCVCVCPCPARLPPSLSLPCSLTPTTCNPRHPRTVLLAARVACVHASRSLTRSLTLSHAVRAGGEQGPDASEPAGGEAWRGAAR